MYKSSNSKRQHFNNEYTGKENVLYHEQQHNPPVCDLPLETHLFPAIHPPEHIDELFKWLDEDNTKFIDFDGVDLGFLSTSLTEIDFF